MMTERDLAIILVIEDRPSIRELLKVILKSRHQVIEAAELPEAIRLARSIHPDLMLLNLHLGKHKGGLAVSRALRRDPDPALAQVPILVIAEAISEADMKAAFAAGVTECVSNSHDPLALLEMINMRLAKPRI